MSRRSQARAFLCSWLAVTTGVISWYFWSVPQSDPSDLYQIWGAARALLDGLDPYTAVGPGATYEWRFPLLYPFTAVLAGIPFALVPMRLADPLFVAIGTGALAWALTRERLDNPQLLAFASAAYLFALQTSQWSPLIMAAAFLPVLGPLLACKPTLAAALLCAYPSRIALIGAGAFLLASVVIAPSWPRDWLATWGTATHMTPYAARLSIGGPIMLVALLRWRRPEARLLLGMSGIPQTTLLYEALPLFLVPQRIAEAAVLSALTIVAVIGMHWSGPFATFEEWTSTSGAWVLWCVYVPCLAMVLIRPNVSSGR